MEVDKLLDTYRRSDETGSPQVEDMSHRGNPISAPIDVLVLVSDANSRHSEPGGLGGPELLVGRSMDCRFFDRGTSYPIEATALLLAFDPVLLCVWSRPSLSCPKVNNRVERNATFRSA